MGADATVYEQLDAAMTSAFDGYDKLVGEDTILALTVTSEEGASKLADSLSEGEMGSVIVAKTPFYGTMGGQTGDSGVIKTENGTFIVQDTIHVAGSKIAHIGYVESGSVSVKETATLSVDAARRAKICNNHSATHLLQKALKTVLGDHVEQAGSLVEDGRLRFDFTHNQAMTAEEIAKVEAIVNKEIAEDLAVDTRIMGIEDAKKTGAMALFGEKYGDEVRVVSMGDFSIELCGGTHVAHTGLIGTFKIQSEQGISAGVRRIEALTGEGAFAYYKDVEAKLLAAAAAAKTDPDRLAERIEALLEEVKKLNQENQKLKAEAAKSAASDVMGNVVTAGDLSILPVSLTDVDMNELRNLGDEFKAKLGKSVVILASNAGGKVNLLVMASDDAVAAGIHAGNIVKKIAPMVGGGGGGRPNMAQAGGKDPSGIDAALAAGVEEAKNQL